MVDEGQFPVFEAERTVFGASHAELGAYLLGLWGFVDYDRRGRGPSPRAKQQQSKAEPDRRNRPLRAGICQTGRKSSPGSERHRLFGYRVSPIDGPVQSSRRMGTDRGRCAEARRPGMSTRVLIVDDDTNLLAGLRRQFRNRFDLHFATGGDEALAAIDTEGSFAVAMVDMRMPGMDGVTLLAELHKRTPDTVRIMLTGNADQQTAVDAINKGHIFRFFSKPCAPEDLANGIEAGLRQYELLMAERVLLEKTLAGSVKVLVDVLSTIDPTGFGRATRCAGLVPVTGEGPQGCRAVGNRARGTAFPARIRYGAGRDRREGEARRAVVTLRKGNRRARSDGQPRPDRQYPAPREGFKDRLFRRSRLRWIGGLARHEADRDSDPGWRPAASCPVRPRPRSGAPAIACHGVQGSFGAARRL